METVTTLSNDYDFPERVCDNCEIEILGLAHFHWESKDFDLCINCLVSLNEKVFHVDKNENVATKSKAYIKVPIPEELRWSIWNRDNFTCQYCGKRECLSVDHITPESQGGKMSEKNLVTACKSCNSRKRARTPEEAGMTLMNDPR